MADLTMTLRKLVVTPQGGAPFLLVEVEVRADGKVISGFQIPGSIVASLAERLAAIRDQHPELAGRVGVVKDRVDWEAGVDPGKVSWN